MSKPPQENQSGKDDASRCDTSSKAHSPHSASDEQPDPRLLELLVCPVTKTRLTYDASKAELISKAAGLAFPVRNGVPLMIVEAARNLDDD